MLAVCVSLMVKLIPSNLFGQILSLLLEQVMEKSWNFWNFEIFWNFWKSHGILKLEQKVMEKSWNLTSKFLILMNRRRYACQTPTNMYVDIEVMEFCDTVMEKSWNFVAKISWQPCRKSSQLTLLEYLHLSSPSSFQR